MNLEQYSQPLSRDENNLRTIYTLNPRDGKKWRLWLPVFDERFPYNEHFSTLPFVYFTLNHERNNISGNHYHLRKREILIPVAGIYEFHLEDIRTWEKESFIIDSSKESKAVYVPIEVSHKVVSLLDTGALCVLASTPSSLEDEIEYAVE